MATEGEAALRSGLYRSRRERAKRPKVAVLVPEMLPFRNATEIFIHFMVHRIFQARLNYENYMFCFVSP